VSRTEIALLHLANALVVATGVVYAVMRYLLEPAEEWAVVNHPWQPHVQHLHVLVAPALVFAVGLIWSAHVLPKLLNGRKGRMTGLGLLVGFAPMAMSGYAIQITIDEGWRKAWIVVHLVSSLLWICAFVLHLIRTLIARRKERAEESESVGIDLAA
jgi:hypothetical protein